MNDYEAKQEAKRARLHRAAQRAHAESERRGKAADDMLSMIPAGQPILIGHHSEKRHRRHLDRASNNIRKSIEAEKEAKELHRRAEAVGTGGISSDDPDAAEKLTDKTSDLEVKRDRMKAINAYYRKHGTLDGAETAGHDAHLLAHGRRTLVLQPYHRQPFPSYALTNIGARIRDAKKRTAEVERIAARRDDEPTREEIGTVAVVTTDPAENRVALSFTRRLSKEEFRRVKSFGFLWSPTRNAFVRKLSGGAVEVARMIARQIAPKDDPTPAWSAWLVTFRVGEREAQTWTRFGPDKGVAERMAHAALATEFPTGYTLVSVEPTADPRKAG